MMMPNSSKLETAFKELEEASQTIGIIMTCSPLDKDMLINHTPDEWPPNEVSKLRMQLNLMKVSAEKFRNVANAIDENTKDLELLLAIYDRFYGGGE